jgi:hypothetical protein
MVADAFALAGVAFYEESRGDGNMGMSQASLKEQDRWRCRDWFQGSEDWTRAIELGEVWRGGSPSTSGIELRQQEGGEELR